MVITWCVLHATGGSVSQDPISKTSVPGNDNSGDNQTQNTGDGPTARFDLGEGLLMALRLYSRLPTGKSPHTPPKLALIAPALPLASVMIGLPAALFLAVWCVLGLPELFGAVLAVIIGVLVTGAMSEDALGDSADGLFSGQSVAQRLAVLKDSRMGAYGTIAIVLLLLARVSALAALSEAHPVWGAIAWLSATIIARSVSLWLPLSLPPARTDGLGAAAAGITRRAFGIGVVGAVFLAAFLSFPFTGLLGIGVALILVSVGIAAWAWFCRRQIGGYTGDLVGGGQALLEIAMLAAFIGTMGL